MERGVCALEQGLRKPILLFSPVFGMTSGASPGSACRPRQVREHPREVVTVGFDLRLLGRQADLGRPPVGVLGVWQHHDARIEDLPSDGPNIAAEVSAGLGVNYALVMKFAHCSCCAKVES